MKQDKFHSKHHKTTFIAGDWNAIDDESGFKVKASEMSKQWDGARMRNPRERHPQDFIRATPDLIRTPWTRTELDDTFIN